MKREATLAVKGGRNGGLWHWDMCLAGTGLRLWDGYHYMTQERAAEAGRAALADLGIVEVE